MNGQAAGGCARPTALTVPARPPSSPMEDSVARLNNAIDELQSVISCLDSRLDFGGVMGGQNPSPTNDVDKLGTNQLPARIQSACDRIGAAIARVRSMTDALLV